MRIILHFSTLEHTHSILKKKAALISVLPIAKFSGTASSSVVLLKTIKAKCKSIIISEVIEFYDRHFE
jgi:hypothetical protein